MNKDTKKHDCILYHLMVAVSALLTVIFLSACDENVTYYHYNTTPLVGWEKNDTLKYEVPPLKDPGTYREEIGIRISAEYPFTSLGLIIEQHFYPGKRVKKDILRCQFTDTKGHFKGRGTNYFQYNYLLRNVDLRRNDSIHIIIKHDMKREILPGISEVGIKLTRKK